MWAFSNSSRWNGHSYLTNLVSKILSFLKKWQENPNGLTEFSFFSTIFPGELRLNHCIQHHNAPHKTGSFPHPLQTSVEHIILHCKCCWAASFWAFLEGTLAEGEIAESKCDNQGFWKNTTMLTLKMWHVSAPRAAGLRTPTLYDFLDTFCRLCPVLTIILILVFCPSHWGIEIHNSSYYTSSASKCISSGYYTL